MPFPMRIGLIGIGLDDPDDHCLRDLTNPAVHAKTTPKMLGAGEHVYAAEPIATIAEQGTPPPNKWLGFPSVVEAAATSNMSRGIRAPIAEG